MPQKILNGDLNITGDYKQNGTILSGGTKLYKHEISLDSGSSLIIFNNNPDRITKLTETNYVNSFGSNVINGGLHTGKSIIGFKQLYTGTGGYNGFVLYLSTLTNDGTNVSETLSFLTHDNSDVSDTVTAL